LRVYKDGSLFNSTIEYLVVFGSFKRTKGKSTGTENKEVGFTADLRSSDGIYYKLTVLRVQFSASLTEIIEKK
jgi:hypothetical protein